MGGMRKMEACLYVAPCDRTVLERVIADGKTPQKLATRARIVLSSGLGLGTMAIAQKARVSKPTVWRWQEAYMEGGIERLRKDKDKGPTAGKPRISDEVRLRIVTMTAKEKPANATHWSARMLAKEVGVGHTTVQRVWKEHGLKPHLTRSFKLSKDRQFAEKVQDVVGLYLDPPDNALVLSVDEKSQIQALDRTQPGLPLKKGRAGTMTHDYKRNGTTTLFAALVAAKAKSVTELDLGEVIGQCMPRHRAKEFLLFLKKIDATVAKRLDVHIICDNYRTHKTKEIQAWLAKHPRFKMHFTPTSSSWLNLVERLFAEITRQRIRRGAFTSVADLEAAIQAWIADRNSNPKPFKWTANADTILAKNARARRSLQQVMAGTK